MNVAIVTAGGVGSRMKSEVPKQFITVNEIPIIIYTLKKFQSCGAVDKIVVPCLKEWQPILKGYIALHKISKVDSIVDNGQTGPDSIMNGLIYLKDKIKSDDIIIVHDGNRPLVTCQNIEDAVKCCKKNGNAVAAIPTNEVVLEATTKSSFATKILDRDAIKRTQTPHVFKYAEVVEIFEKNRQKGFSPVAAVDGAVNLKRKIYLSEGSPINFKITEPDDLTLFKAYLERGDDV
ncbi:MAG: 2-C-methyl-D-erythritol 4-phosphate cytidylyltransferase [Candidatus Nomurabacteria bacterium]|jgi:2-C-methyl-D-erythritol 4-phosphate cytidylyltransferase|nr:2-C-methyl-D-erythritol 4-phosphate cytidylyltransferase [Candidatus Nomurabacteria bacterium]